MFACATTKHQGSYVTSLKVKSNTNLSSIYKYIDITKTEKRILSFQTGFINKPMSPWEITQQLDVIKYEDLTCLTSVYYELFGSWDNDGAIRINNITIGTFDVNWWLPCDLDLSVLTAPRLMGYGTRRFGCNDSTNPIYRTHRDYDYISHKGYFSSDQINLLIENSVNNSMTIIGFIEDKVNGPSFSGGADGHLDLYFKFISHRK